MIRAGCFIGATLAVRGDVAERYLDCDGQWDRHHLIRKNRLKQELPPSLAEKAIGDKRDQVDTCRHHHELVENRRVELFRDELPGGIEDFAHDFGLEGWLDRYYPPRAAA